MATENNIPFKFWTMAKNKKGEAYVHEILITNLIGFLMQYGGIRRLTNSKTSFELVQIKQGKIVERIGKHVLTEIVKKYLKEIDRKDVMEKYLKSDYTTEKTIVAIDAISIKVGRGTKDTAYLYFNNGVVCISKDSIEIKDYQDFDNYLLVEQINDREFTLVDFLNSDFNNFAFNVSGRNIERYKSLCTILGYLIHGYKDPSVPVAVILTDQNIDFSGGANGGTGKSILGQAVGKMVPLLSKEGKNLSDNNRFFFQDIELHHQVVYYDDVRASFELEAVYSAITNGISVERKYKSPVFIPYDEAPKILISSNYIVKGADGYTDERRRIEFEVAPYYGKHKTPLEEFGKRFFSNDWDEKDWNSFDSFMVFCAQKFLIHGLLYPKSINLQENKLKQLTHPAFVVFADANIIEGRYDKAELLSSFKETYPDFKSLTQHTFTKWINTWGKCRSVVIASFPSNGRYYIDVTKLR